MIESVEFDPRLIEAAVLSAMRRTHPDRDISGCGPSRRHDEQAPFDSERARIYELPEGAQREAAFGRFHSAWFGRLGLDRPVREALREAAAGLRAAGRCLVWPATGGRHAGAELFAADHGHYTVVVSVRPEMLADPAATGEFFHRELLHVTDMLDPEFRYEPRLPPHAAGPAHDRLLQERYRVLWAASVEGRLARRGQTGEAARARRRAEFRGLFACLGDRLEECFDLISGDARPPHPALVAMARDPVAGFGLEGPESPSGGAPHRCALCGFPTVRFEPAAGRLARKVVAAIRADFPGWDADRGVCLQCADLYRARSAGAQSVTNAPR